VKRGEGEVKISGVCGLARDGILELLMLMLMLRLRLRLRLRFEGRERGGWLGGFVDSVLVNY